MDELHIKYWKSNLQIKKILTKLPNFNDFFSSEDISRISSKYNWPLINIQQLYNFCEELNEKVISQNIEITQSDIKNGLGGGYYINDKLYILCYCKLKICIPNNTTWTFNIPLIGNFKKTNEDDIIILIPVENAKYIILNIIDEINDVGILIFPGSIKMDENNLGFYESLDLLIVNEKLNDENYRIQDLKLNLNNLTRDNIIQYLIDFHTKKVQTGYFSNKNSSLKESFNLHGMNFYVDDPNSSSYYEKLINQNLNNQLHLPFENIDEMFFIKLYIRKNDILENNINNPIPASLKEELNFDFKVDVNIKLIDLNFIWTITDLQLNSKLSIENQIVANKNTFYSKIVNQNKNKPDLTGKFYLNPSDKKCLAYFTHSPNIIFILNDKQYKDGQIF
jgi:hypothetical protein